MTDLEFEVLKKETDTLPFKYKLFSPCNTLAKGIILLVTPPDKTDFSHLDTVSSLLEGGYCVVSLIPDSRSIDLDGHVEGYCTLLDIIRKKYRFLPIIVFGSFLSSITARVLAEKESDRISGVILEKPCIPSISAVSAITARLICAVRGKDYSSDLLGNYGISLYSALSFLKRSKRINTEEAIADYPKHLSTLIVNSESDTLFEALDDVYVSHVEKAFAGSPEELIRCITDFADRVVSGVNDAMTSDRFIYRGTES